VIHRLLRAAEAIFVVLLIAFVASQLGLAPFVVLAKAILAAGAAIFGAVPDLVRAALQAIQKGFGK